MRVVELWRFPVKSMQGERLDRVDVGTDGLVGDRAFAIFDLDTGNGLTARRAPELLFAAARLRGDGVEITLPDGSIAADDAALSNWLGRRVTLRSADADVTRSYEVPLDVETEAADTWVTWNGPRGAFHDSTKARVSLVSTATLGDWDGRRFRANVILDGNGEDALVGSQVTIGSVVLDVVKRIDRCVMVTRPQPGGIERDLTVFTTVAKQREGFLSVGALVQVPGTVQIGDDLIGN